MTDFPWWEREEKVEETFTNLENNKVLCESTIGPTVIVVRVWRGLELNLFAAVNVVVARTQKEGGANKQNREGEALLFERDVSALVSVDIFQPNFDDDDGCQDDRGVPRPGCE